MKMSDNIYNVLKWISCVFCGALVGLIGTIGGAVGWEYTSLTQTIIGAIGTFIGVCIGVSTYNYNKANNEVKANDTSAK